MDLLLYFGLITTFSVLSWGKHTLHIMNDTKRPRSSGSLSDSEVQPQKQFIMSESSISENEGNVSLQPVSTDVTNKQLLSEIQKVQMCMAKIREENNQYKLDMESKFERFCRQINDTINFKFQELNNHVNMEVAHMSARLSEIDKKTNALDKKVTDKGRGEFNPEVTIIASNIKLSQEPITVTAQKMMDTLGLGHINVVGAVRLASRDGRPGLVKIEFEDVRQKVEVLRHKHNLDLSQDFAGTFIRSAHSHVERIVERNIKTLLKEIPNGNMYRVTGHGILVKKDDSENRPYNRKQLNKGNSTGDSNQPQTMTPNLDNSTLYANPGNYKQPNRSTFTSANRTLSQAQWHTNRPFMPSISTMNPPRSTPLSMPTPVNQIRACLPQQQYGTPITTSHQGPVQLQGHGQPPPIPPKSQLLSECERDGATPGTHTAV